jgi:hypothetical protein
LKQGPSAPSREETILAFALINLPVKEVPLNWFGCSKIIVHHAKEEELRPCIVYMFPTLSISDRA